MDAQNIQRNRVILPSGSVPVHNPARQRNEAHMAAAYLHDSSTIQRETTRRTGRVSCRGLFTR